MHMNKMTLAVGLAALMLGGAGDVEVARADDLSDVWWAGAPRAALAAAFGGSVGLASSAVPLSEREREALIYMREEEKLARDVYRTLYSTWGLPVFSTIANSEQAHMDAVQSALVQYGIEDPVVDDTVGAFSSPEMKQLYADLVARGSGSVRDALRVGAAIEDIDICDLAGYLGTMEHADLLLVFEHLMRGTRNHLRAFTSQLAALGETYAPQYLSAEEYEAIVCSVRETGNAARARGGYGMRHGGNGRSY